MLAVHFAFIRRPLRRGDREKVATCLPRGGERERRRRKKENEGREEPSDKLLLSSFLSPLFPTFRLRDGRCSPTTFDKLLFQTENRPLLPCSSSRLSARLFPHSSRNSWWGGLLVPTIARSGERLEETRRRSRGSLQPYTNSIW